MHRSSRPDGFLDELPAQRLRPNFWHPQGRVTITFTVDAAGPGVNMLGPLFAGIYARNLDRAIPRLQALLRSPDPAWPT